MSEGESSKNVDDIVVSSDESTSVEIYESNEKSSVKEYNFDDKNLEDDSSLEEKEVSVEEDSYTPPKIRANKIWVKRDVNYELDPSYEEKILDKFSYNVSLLKEGRQFIRGDLKDDAFYSNYEPVTINDIETLENSKDLLELTSCKHLRDDSLKLVDLVGDFTKRREETIQLLETPNIDDRCKSYLSESILRKSRIIFYLNKVRAYASKAILSGEKCQRYISEAKSLAYKDIGYLSKHFENETEGEEGEVSE